MASGQAVNATLGFACNRPTAGIRGRSNRPVDRSGTKETTPGAPWVAQPDWACAAYMAGIRSVPAGRRHGLIRVSYNLNVSGRT